MIVFKIKIEKQKIRSAEARSLITFKKHTVIFKDKRIKRENKNSWKKDVD